MWKKYGKVRQPTVHGIIRRMRNACCMIEATDTLGMTYTVCFPTAIQVKRTCLNMPLITDCLSWYMMLYAFFSAIYRRLKFMYLCFGMVVMKCTYPPMKMEHTQCSETLAFKLQTPVNHPDESIRHSEQGERLISRIVKCYLEDFRFEKN
jgi:hypothetical protein